VALPDGDRLAFRPWDKEPTPLQLALARGHRWLAMLESGEVRSMKEIARHEGFDISYVSRMVNLATLAPDIVAAIFDETLPEEVTLFKLAAEVPVLWYEQ
jgi:hypothetical protein